MNRFVSAFLFANLPLSIFLHCWIFFGKENIFSFEYRMFFHCRTVCPALPPDRPERDPRPEQTYNVPVPHVDPSVRRHGSPTAISRK